MKSLSNTEAPNNFVLIGKVIGAHGIKGAIKILSFTESPDFFDEQKRLLLKGTDGEQKEFTISKTNAYKNIIRITLKEIKSRDQAESLIGSEILVQRTYLPDLEEETYYWVDLIGLSVYTCESEFLGRLDSIMNTGSNDVFVVINQDEGKEKEILIPALKSVIQEVNLEQKVMKVDLPDGLR